MYKSLFSPEKEVSARQYIVELLCKNRAAALKTTLPLQFYKLPEWALYYKSQLRKCDFYLQNYDPAIIIKVVVSKKIYSMNAKWIDSEFKKEYDSTLKNTKNIVKKVDKINYERTENNTGLEDKDIDFSYLD